MENTKPVSYIKLADGPFEITGKYTGSFVGGNYNTPTHYFELENEKVGINGFKVLNEELEKFEEGDLIQVIYEGKKNGKNFPYHSAKVLPGKA